VGTLKLKYHKWSKNESVWNRRIRRIAFTGTSVDCKSWRPLKYENIHGALEQRLSEAEKQNATIFIVLLFLFGITFIVYGKIVNAPKKQRKWFKYVIEPVLIEFQAVRNDCLSWACESPKFSDQLRPMRIIMQMRTSSDASNGALFIFFI
jgi:hypothetical protein